MLTEAGSATGVGDQVGDQAVGGTKCLKSDGSDEVLGRMSLGAKFCHGLLTALLLHGSFAWGPHAGNMAAYEH